jgi:hypothetical protein
LESALLYSFPVIQNVPSGVTFAVTRHLRRISWNWSG